MIFDNNSLSKLRSSVKKRLSEKRYLHTLGVERMARFLGGILIPNKIYELSAAALLHDIAKELMYEEQINLLMSDTAVYSPDDLSTKPTLHSFAAVPIIKQAFKEYATEDIMSAVANHTLGAPGMSIFDEIIFISDYAEEGRTYPTCKEINIYLTENVCNEKSYEDNLLALHKASLKATESTIFSLKIRNERINKRTLSTKKYLEELIENK